MGTTASVSLTNEQKVLLTAKLRSIYAENVDKSNDKIQPILLEEYKQYIAALLQSPDSPSGKVSVDKKLTVAASAKIQPKKTLTEKAAERTEKKNSMVGGKKGPTRRRSFDPNAGQQPQKPGAMVVTASEPSLINQALESALAAANASSLLQQEQLASVKMKGNSVKVVSVAGGAVEEVAADSWDSVSTQPYCDICKMAFKSISFLDRHIKYSSIHMQKLKELELQQVDGAAEGVSMATAAAPIEEVRQEVPHIATHRAEDTVNGSGPNANPDEGKHFRLLYSGSKFYWRSGQAVDFDLYHHFDAAAIEIIPHHNANNKELPRIYLSYPIMARLVEQAVQDEVKAKVKEILKDRFARPFDREALRDEFLLKKLVTFMLSRLSYEVTNKGGEGEEEEAIQQETVSLTQFVTDAFPPGFLLPGPPHGLKPILISRRRKSSAEEIDNAINHVSASIEHASKLSSTAHEYHATASTASASSDPSNGGSGGPSSGLAPPAGAGSPLGKMELLLE